MPLGNLTSQFFANIYLNELDYFIKRVLRAKYYLRYVDDFIILYRSREQLEKWKTEINKFLSKKLKIQLHPDKSKVLSLSNGVDFIGFRNFYYKKVLRKRNVKKMFTQIDLFHNKEVSKGHILEIFQGWQAHAKWATAYQLRKKVVKTIYSNN